MNGQNDALIEATLRRAEYGRSNNFDIIQKGGYVFLREEIVDDFPYLTINELRNIITLGVKGEIDRKSTRPLNCTRIYQWVKTSVQFTLSFWEKKHPDLMAWPKQLGLIGEMQDEISSYETPGEAFYQPHKFRQLLQRVVQSRYRDLVADHRGELTNAAAFPEQAAIYEHIRTVEYPTYLLQYPDPKTSGQPIF